jgi:hypothetical protein
MKVHTFQKKPRKKWAHEGSQHNPRICSFEYVRNEYLQGEINKDPKANKSEDESRTLQDPA